jgi:catechol 2,3-dioxygenase-like lactoylglutathione lyase family enzyme
MKATIGHIILSVSDWEKSKKFYDTLMSALGFEVELDDSGNWGGIKAYHQGEHGLYIYHESDKDYKQFERFPGLNHIAFKVENREDVDEMYKLVQSLSYLECKGLAFAFFDFC